MVLLSPAIFYLHAWFYQLALNEGKHMETQCVLCMDVRAIFQKLHPVLYPQPNEVSDEVCLKGDRGNTPDAGQFSISCGNGSAGQEFSRRVNLEHHM